MKKILLTIMLLSLILMPVMICKAEGIVPCQNGCTIGDFFTMLGNIYNFLVLYIATPLAILGLTIGGVMYMISAGDPGLAQKGKDALWASFWGLILTFGSWLIIKAILSALGYVYTF